MTLVINHLKAYRLKKGLTQEQLAERVGVTRQTIISIENNHYTPSLELALKLAWLFKCSVKALFNVGGEK
ncbi:MAG: helix-turn-helix transcriptional regulator [Candidatus Nanoarchaeia archaeon]